MKALVVLFIFPLVAVASDLPNCHEKLKEELDRQSLSWSKSEIEDRDSDLMLDEYQAQKAIVDRYEAQIAMPARPDYEKFKSMPAFRRAMDEWSKMTMQAVESMQKHLAETKLEYKSAFALVEKYKTPGERFFFDFVRDGSSEFDKVIFFPKKDKALVTAYVKNGRLQGYHTMHAASEHDIIRFDFNCKIDGAFVHHGKLLEKVDLNICDSLDRLKPLVEAAAANPGDDVEDLPQPIQCQEQGGDWDGQKCVCPMYKGKLLHPIMPSEETCLEERFVTAGQRLRDFAELNNSHIEPDKSALPIVERVCKRYFTVALKAPVPGTRTPAKASSTKK